MYFSLMCISNKSKRLYVHALLAIFNKIAARRNEKRNKNAQKIISLQQWHDRTKNRPTCDPKRTIQIVRFVLFSYYPRIHRIDRSRFQVAI